MALNWLKDASDRASAAAVSRRPPRAPLANHVDAVVAAVPAFRDSIAPIAGSESGRGRIKGGPWNAVIIAKAETEVSGKFVFSRQYVPRRLPYYVASSNAHWQSATHEPREPTEIDDNRIVDFVLRSCPQITYRFNGTAQTVRCREPEGLRPAATDAIR